LKFQAVAEKTANEDGLGNERVYSYTTTHTLFKNTQHNNTGARTGPKFS